MERQTAAKTSKAPLRGNHIQRKPSGPSTPVHRLVALQNTIGNQATQRLINSRFVQAKLKVSTPDDPAEKEADHVAETVMRMPESKGDDDESKATPVATTLQTSAQRAVDDPAKDENPQPVETRVEIQRAPVAVREDDEDEEKVAKKPEEDKPVAESTEEKVDRATIDSTIQRQAKSDEDKVDEPPILRKHDEEEESEKVTQAPVQRAARDTHESEDEEKVHAKSNGQSTLASHVQTMNGGGSPLPNSTRSFFESRFGSDFSGVRVHTDSRAAQSARSINARAFTVGQNIAFANGEYSPESHGGKSLLAHELTHVVQQNGARTPSPTVNSKQDTIMRAPSGVGGDFGGGSSGGGGAGSSFGGPGGGGGGTGGSPKLREPVELKGKANFSPDPDTEADIKGNMDNPVSVAVKFGSLALSELPVIWNGTWYDSGPPPPNYDGHPLPIHHDDFPMISGARPMLGININQGIVSGFLGWETSASLAKEPDKFFEQHPLSELFGLEGLASDPPDFSASRNKLGGGKLDYFQPTNFAAGDFDGEADISLQDEKYSFTGEIEVNEVKGIDKPMPLKKEGSKLFGDHKWKFERSMGVAGGRLSGEIIGTYAGGIPDVRGTLKYNRAKPNVSGSVTVLITTFDIAKEKVRDQLGTDAPSTISPADPSDRLAITGWGHVDFAFNEWLTGNADVIVHPEGYVTAKGEIVPTAVIPLLKKREMEDKPLFHGVVEEPIPELDAIVADIALQGSLDITGYASMGPGTMHDLRVMGLFSTDPAIVNTFELSGIVSIPAIAGIHAEAGLGLTARIAKAVHLSTVKLVIKGDLALQMYAEAAAAAGRRKGDDGEPEYFLKGKLEGGAGLKLDIHAGVSAKLAFWEKHIDLYNRTFTIAGGSATIDFDYVLGKKAKKGEDALKLNVNLGSFDADKFAAAVVRGETVEDKKYKGKDQADGSLETDPNPDAPTPVQPPDPSDPGSGTPSGIDKTLEEDFEMEGQQHELRLALTDPPQITMQSALEPLLNKVERARKAIKKDKGLSAPEKSARNADLDKIVASANGVTAAAKRGTFNPPYITPQIPGFTELAQLIADYGKAYNVTDLSDALDKVIVDPAKAETVLKKYPELAANELVKAQVSRIMAAGVDASDMRQIVENVRPSNADTVVEITGILEKMINSGADNWESIITDLRIGGNKFKGANFVIRYIDTRFPDWADVNLEVKNESTAVSASGRRWDAWIQGDFYQFKSWYKWPDIASRTFIRQILEDYKLTRVGQDLPLHWVFETSLTREEIVAKMKAALQEVIDDLKAGKTPKIDGYTVDIAEFIQSRADSFVKVAEV